MTRTFTVCVIALGLVLNGLYQGYLAIQSLSSSALAWGALSVASGWGIWHLPVWSRYSITFVAAFSMAGWLDGTIQNFRRGLWPYHDTTSTALSLIPAFFWILWWGGTI